MARSSRMRIKSMFKMLYLLSLVSGRRVKERFKPIPPGFLLRGTAPAEMPAEMAGGIPGMPSFDPSHLFREMNVTTVTSRQPKVGEVVNETTCEYDGMVGMVQRNEADMLGHVVRPDSTPCEPGTFLTLSGLDDSPRVFSVRQFSNKTVVQDILYLWNNFPVTVWYYFIYSLIICSIILSMIYAVLQSVLFTRNMVTLFMDSFWDYYLLSVDTAPTSISPYKSGTVIWTCIVLGLFYALHIVLLGTLSTDLVVAIKPREIETLQDLLYDPEFNETQPIIMRQLNMYSVLKNSRNGTDARVLFDKISENETASIKQFNHEDPQNLLQSVLGLVQEAVQGKIVMIENSEFITPVLINGLCFINATLISSLRPANDIISQSMLSTLVSKQTPDSVRLFLQYRITTFTEFGLIKGTAQTMGKVMLSSVAKLPLTTDGLICGEKFDKTFRRELDIPWLPFDIAPFMRLFRICLGVVVLAALSSVVEGVAGYIDRINMKRNEMIERKRRRTRRVCVHCMTK